VESVRKVVVITNEKSQVAGTHQPRANDASYPIRGGLRAGPGQRLHEIDIEAPDKFESSEHIARFHEKVRQHLVSKGAI
jgi:hypothetical protein